MRKNKMTLVKDLTKEYTRIMRRHKGEPIDLARRYASGAYLALELGLEKRAKSAVERSISSYQDGLIATTDRKEYASIQGEQELVRCLRKCHKDEGRYWDSSDEKLYVKKMHDFLNCLRKKINPDPLEFIAEQKGWLQILSQGDCTYFPPGTMETFFEQLVSYKERAGQLPAADFPGIHCAIDSSYNYVLESCSGGHVYHGRKLVHPDLFKETFEKTRDILKANPSNELINGWIDKKLDYGRLRDASAILTATGFSKDDIKLTHSFDDYLPRVCRFDYWVNSRDQDDKPFSFPTRGWEWIEENTSSKIPVAKIRRIYTEMIKLKKEEGMRKCVGDMSSDLSGDYVYSSAPSEEFWDEKIALVHKVTGVKPPVVKQKTTETITFEK